MPESKFKFNPDTLQFEGRDISKTQKLLINGSSIFVGSIFIFLIIFISFSFINEANYNRKNQGEISILNTQLEILIERKKQNDAYLKELIEKDKKIHQAVFKTNPDNSVFDINNPFAKFSAIDFRTIFNQNSKRLSITQEVLSDHKNKYLKIIELINKKEGESLKSIPAIQPIYNKNLKYPVYGFGKKIDQVYKSLIFHPGIDYAASEGTVVFATADGIVKKAGEIRGLGKRIEIDHQTGYQTVYAHLGDINVYVGKKVKRGDKIGTIGMTGKSLIPHLHYEVVFKGKQVNPINYFYLDLNPIEYDKITKEASRSGLSLD